MGTRKEGVLITRCLWPAILEAQKDPRKIPEIVNSQPEHCPGFDCSPGVCCRQVVREYMLVQWKIAKIRGWTKKEDHHGAGKTQGRAR